MRGPCTFTILYLVALTHLQPHPIIFHFMQILALHHPLDPAMTHHRLITFDSYHKKAYFGDEYSGPREELFVTLSQIVV
jgi:hypothetical protein